ncbi:DUF2239 family protein [Luteibacter sp. CQ10]|uniref:DUF2239 family protein n=1 Tax=Luteibacter sp. CQ10 TaxID=2805821 RepID=UPI0034A13611
MTTYTAFDGHRLIASGPLPLVAEQCKSLLDEHPDAQPIIYDDTTGRSRDVDYRGALQEVLGRLMSPEPDAPVKRGPGRPRLGVVAREVTLLPRHWDWLAAQPGGASVALRRLVETASRDAAPADRRRQRREAVDRVMFALAGDLPHYEEASRAFHRHEPERFAEWIAAWPDDVRDYVTTLATRAEGAE